MYVALGSRASWFTLRARGRDRMVDVFYTNQKKDSEYFLEKCPACGCEKHQRHRALPDIDLVECVDCELTYSKYRQFNIPRHQDDWEADLDKIEDYYDKQFDEKNSLYFDFIKTHAGKVHSLLDIGAAYGAFVFFCRQKGLMAEGIELSATACELAKSKFGLDLINEKLESSGELKGVFDVVSSFDVIEHIDELQGFLSEVNDAVRDDGHFILTVPNNRSLTNILCFLSYKLSFGIIDMPVRMLTQTNYQSHHVSYFHKRTLVDTLQRAGFEPTSMATLSTINKDEFFNRPDIGSGAVKFFGKLVVSFVQALEALLDQKDTIMIIAKKKRHTK